MVPRNAYKNEIFSFLPQSISRFQGPQKSLPNMSSLIQALGLLALITSVAASSGTGNAWNKVARAVGDEIVLTTVALHQPNLDHAERLLAEISDPQSDKFGNYLDEEAMVHGQHLVIANRV